LAFDPSKNVSTRCFQGRPSRPRGAARSASRRSAGPLLRAGRSPSIPAPEAAYGRWTSWGCRRGRRGSRWPLRGPAGKRRSMIWRSRFVSDACSEVPGM
jgi:hypothetical protein